MSDRQTCLADNWSVISHEVDLFYDNVSQYLHYLPFASDPATDATYLFHASRFFHTLAGQLLSLNKRAEPDLASHHDPIVRAIFNQLHNSIETKYSLDRLASELYYSPQYLCNHFKKQTGTTIGAYFNTLKVNEVCRYLRTTNKSIAEIAYTLNFSSSQHLSRVFRNVKSVTPLQYRHHD